jgi:hypothetical protein
MSGERKPSESTLLLDGTWEPFTYIEQLERSAQRERRQEGTRRASYRERLSEINFQIDRARRFIAEHGLSDSRKP